MTAAAVAIVAREYLIGHESAHAAAAVVLGVELSRIRVVRNEDSPGAATIHPDPDRPWDTALCVLAGPLHDPASPTPRWPVRFGETSDEKRLSVIFEEQGWDEEEWRRLHLEALRLTARDDFNRAELVFKTALDLDPLIEGDHLRHLIDYIHDLLGDRNAAQNVHSYD